MSEIIKDFNLRACPFCGGKAIIESWDMTPYEKLGIDNPDGRWYSVFCSECCSSGPDCLTAVDAVNEWNQRTSEPAKYGYWLPVDEKEDAFDCSECDAMVQKKHNFCPKCGVRMIKRRKIINEMV